MNDDQAFFWAFNLAFFFLSSAQLHSALKERERGGELRHLRKVLRVVLTTTLHSSFQHGLHWASLLGEEGWLSLKHLMLAASMLL